MKETYVREERKTADEKVLGIIFAKGQKRANKGSVFASTLCSPPYQIFKDTPPNSSGPRSLRHSFSGFVVLFTLLLFVD